jgi:hypothetical protein
VSDSPNLQDGRLWGAVTYVPVANPRGYGICAEDMPAAPPPPQQKNGKKHRKRRVG